MTGPILRLRHDDLLRVLDAIDLLDLVTWRVTDGQHRPRTCRFVPNPMVSGPEKELTAIQDLSTGRICLLPTCSLQMICMAGLAGLAARELLPPGAVTATVFGSGAVAHLHLGVIARYLPGVRGAKVCPTGAGIEPPVARHMRDQLELAGIGLSVVTEPRRAVVGAKLLIIAELGWLRLDIGRLPPGVLLINAARRDLPDELLADVDELYVDDLGLLEHNQHRRFVQLHGAAPGAPVESTPQRGEARHRQPGRWRRQQRIGADLGRVLMGRHERTESAAVALVELLSGDFLDVHLADHIHRTAFTLGLGSRINDAEEG